MNNMHTHSEKKVTVNWIRWLLIAASVVLVSCAVIYLVGRNAKNSEPFTANGVSGIIVDGVTYYKSGWDTIQDECPKDFQYAGIVDSVNQDGAYLKDCKYYKNPQIPEWIYVNCEVWESSPNGQDGEITYMGYVRFVTPDARFKYFIFYDNHLYESMKTHYGDNSEELYSNQTEILPEECVLIGSAHIEELDRIPRTNLGVNYTDYDHKEVYANTNDNQVLYVSNSWYTSTEEEKKETLHNGYDVFVLYDPDQ